MQNIAKRDESLDRLISRLIHTSEALEEQLKTESELESLTPRQARCTEIIAELKNPTPSELAQLIGISKPSVSVMLEKMEAGGYLKKVRSDKDRRAAHVHLTPKGEMSADLHHLLHRNISELLIRGFTDQEKRDFSKLLIKAVASLEAAASGNK